MGQTQRRKRLDREYHGLARRKVVNRINPLEANWGFVAAKVDGLGLLDTSRDFGYGRRNWKLPHREWRRLHLQEWGDFDQPKGEA